MLPHNSSVCSTEYLLAELQFVWPLPSLFTLQVMEWSQRHTQISSLCPCRACPASVPSAVQLRWLWFPSWPALPKRPRLPRSAPWRAWRPPRVALQWGATTVRARARHLMLRASPRCHRTRSVETFFVIHPFFQYQLLPELKAGGACLRLPLSVKG